MAQTVLRIAGLPDAALDAAAAFHRDWLAAARRAIAGSEAIVLVFPAAAYDHHGWRLAAVQDLAREAAPARINAVEGNEEQAIATTLDWLAQAPGITGQLLAVD